MLSLVFEVDLAYDKGHVTLCHRKWETEINQRGRHPAFFHFECIELPSRIIDKFETLKTKHNNPRMIECVIFILCILCILLIQIQFRLYPHKDKIRPLP